MHGVAKATGAPATKAEETRRRSRQFTKQADKPPGEVTTVNASRPAQQHGTVRFRVRRASAEPS
ncbi:hypothetical protein SAMN04489742_3774 [Arthrobacter crystallopoietes]|uniref:Uncharacterized protein n=1 Tax=Crystallibacter crystallopoietes TaxID=37928 RepID=A0A1H1G1G5_9MICC|nr:hypothetical protein SAMN04489742_3774 [Arthrobacter crystallopoietes]